MKNNFILLVFLCIYGTGNSQVTLTKDISYGTNGTVDYPLNHNSSWNRHYLTSDNYLTVSMSTNYPDSENIISYDNNGNMLSTIVIPGPMDSSILFADHNNVYPVVDGILYKYSLSGILDSSFGNNGQLFIGSNFMASNYLTASYLPDDKILVRNQNSFTRYNTDGTIDTSYGTNGVVNIATSSSHSILNERIDNNYFFENSNGRRKINIFSGDLDLTYGNNGYTMNTAGDVETVTDSFEVLALLLNGNSSFDHRISKATSDGNIDLNFGTSGSYDLPEVFNNKILYYGLTLGMDNHNNKVFIPLTIRNQQYDETNSMIGISCYSVSTGDPIMTNNVTTFDTGIQGNGNNISIEIKDNYLYLFTQMSVSRYIINEGVLNTNEVNKKDQIEFNNPFSEELKFVTKEKIKEIEIYDANNRSIMRQGFNNHLNTSHLNKGFYTIKLTTESNEIILKKAIKN